MLATSGSILGIPSAMTIIDAGWDRDKHIQNWILQKYRHRIVWMIKWKEFKKLSVR